MKVRLGGLLLTAAVALSAPAYAATTIVFQNGATHNGVGIGDSYSYNVNIGGQAVSLTATGWTDNTSYNPDRIQSADLELYTGSCCGLGVTAFGDGSNNTHTVDNAGYTKDFIVLKFSTAVDLMSAHFNVFDVNQGPAPADGDATVYYKNGAAAPTNNGNASNYFSQFTAIDVPGSSSGSRNVAGPGIFSDTWVVAANLSSNNDGFKLYSVTVDAPAVPEPATWGLMIVGIGLMGSQLRLRRRAAGAVA